MVIYQSDWIVSSCSVHIKQSSWFEKKKAQDYRHLHAVTKCCVCKEVLVLLGKFIEHISVMLRSLDNYHLG